ncbi:MAG TPA: hypothetical protein VFC63_23210 [Blastocatellia bacterium]|nr:hypothetical protein [Blastocatellia bacterium]
MIEVGDLVETNRQEMFAIYFRVPDGVIPAQGSYKLVNSELGELILLLVPVIHDESIIYEAVFNRLKKKKPTA